MGCHPAGGGGDKSEGVTSSNICGVDKWGDRGGDTSVEGGLTSEGEDTSLGGGDTSPVGVTF